MTRQRGRLYPARHGDGRDDAARLGRARFVLLTTYRASGQPVATAVWIVPDGNQVAVLTNANSGKVRRLQGNSALTLVPCNPRGGPHPLALPINGHADVRADHGAVDALWRLIRRKYAVEHTVLRVLGWLKPALRRWDGPQVALLISLETKAGQGIPR